MPKLKLISLQCRKTEDNGGSDEAYITVNGSSNVVWGPTSINNGQAFSLLDVAPIDFTGNIFIQLFDQDAGIFDTDDLLGGHSISSQQIGQGIKSFTGDEASYVLQYEVVADPIPATVPGSDGSPPTGIEQPNISVDEKVQKIPDPFDPFGPRKKVVYGYKLVLNHAATQQIVRDGGNAAVLSLVPGPMRPLVAVAQGELAAKDRGNGVDVEADLLGGILEIFEGKLDIGPIVVRSR